MLGYNVILGRVTLHDLQVISSSYHQCMKFPTETRVCKDKGSQKHVRECYFNAIGEVMVTTWEKEGLPHTIVDQHLQLKLATATKEVLIGDKHINIRPRDPRQVIVQLLRKNKDLFAKELKDLGKINRETVEHKMEVSQGAHLIRKKVCSLRGERKEETAKDVAKLREACFIMMRVTFK